MDVDEKLNVVAGVIGVVLGATSGGVVRKNRKNRRWWVKPWIAERETTGAHHLVFNQLQIQDPESFRNFFRMDKNNFEKLLQLVGPKISKKNTNMRECISADKRLLVTLRFLATGESFKSLRFSTRIPANTISGIVPEVCSALYEVLKVNYLKVPNSKIEWQQVAENYYKICNFPNCIGAIDGKHVHFKAPKNMGSYFRNYKGFDSLVLLAIVDANYKFLYIDVGCNGRVSDGGVLKNSSINKLLVENKLNIPEQSLLPGTNVMAPYVFVADDAFPLQKHIMKPYPSRNLEVSKKIFNYRLSRARRVVENTFGILANRFRILLKKIDLDENKTETIIFACCALHNFIVCEDNKRNVTQFLQGDDNLKQNQLTKLRNVAGNRSGNEPMKIRDTFKDFFCGEGSVPWQLEAIKNFNF